MERIGVSEHDHPKDRREEVENGKEKHDIFDGVNGADERLDDDSQLFDFRKRSKELQEAKQPEQTRVESRYL